MYTGISVFKYSQFLGAIDSSTRSCAALQFTAFNGLQYWKILGQGISYSALNCSTDNFRSLTALISCYFKVWNAPCNFKKTDAQLMDTLCSIQRHILCGKLQLYQKDKIENAEKGKVKRTKNEGDVVPSGSADIRCIFKRLKNQGPTLTWSTNLETGQYLIMKNHHSVKGIAYLPLIVFIEGKDNIKF